MLGATPNNRTDPPPQLEQAPRYAHAAGESGQRHPIPASVYVFPTRLQHIPGGCMHSWATCAQATRAPPHENAAARGNSPPWACAKSGHMPPAHNPHRRRSGAMSGALEPTDTIQHLRMQGCAPIPAHDDWKIVKKLARRIGETLVTLAATCIARYLGNSRCWRKQPTVAVPTPFSLHDVSPTMMQRSTGGWRVRAHCASNAHATRERGQPERPGRSERPPSESPAAGKGAVGRLLLKQMRHTPLDEAARRALGRGRHVRSSELGHGARAQGHERLSSYKSWVATEPKWRKQGVPRKTTYCACDAGAGPESQQLDEALEPPPRRMATTSTMPCR